MSYKPILQGGKEILAMDIDEVVFPLVKEFCVWHNQEYGTLYVPEDFHSYEFNDVLGTDIPETVHRVHTFLGQEHGHKGVTPIDDAVYGVHRLSEEFHIKPVTARHPGFRLVTEEYLDEFFGDVFHEVTLVGHAATMDILKTKADVCVEVGARGIIDDSIVHVTGCVERGLDGILFGNYTWNQSNDLHPKIVRCENWGRVLVHYGLE